MKVWRFISNNSVRCEYGTFHSVYVYAEKNITDTGLVYTFNNGYATNVEKIWEDRQGIKYYSRSPIDFHSGMTFVVYAEDGETVIALFTRHPYQYAVDTFGRKI